MFATYVPQARDSQGLQCGSGMAHLPGYVRVSTLEQNPALQVSDPCCRAGPAAVSRLGSGLEGDRLIVSTPKRGIRPTDLHVLKPVRRPQFAECPFSQPESGLVPSRLCSAQRAQHTAEVNLSAGEPPASATPQAATSCSGRCRYPGAASASRERGRRAWLLCSDKPAPSSLAPGHLRRLGVCVPHELLT